MGTATVAVSVTFFFTIAPIIGLDDRGVAEGHDAADQFPDLPLPSFDGVLEAEADVDAQVPEQRRDFRPGTRVLGDSVKAIEQSHRLLDRLGHVAIGPVRRNRPPKRRFDGLKVLLGSFEYSPDLFANIRIGLQGKVLPDRFQLMLQLCLTALQLGFHLQLRHVAIRGLALGYLREPAAQFFGATCLGAKTLQRLQHEAEHRLAVDLVVVADCCAASVVATAPVNAALSDLHSVEHGAAIVAQVIEAAGQRVI